MPSIADQKTLLSQQYKNEANLQARIQLHQRFSRNKYDWQRWVFDQLKLPEAATVLEIGCGPADLWRGNSDRLPPGWEITLADFSPGMVEAARNRLADQRDRFKFEQADIQGLPFEDQSFEAVIANHMLYHVPDRQKAYAEVGRVLKPGGTFFAATNGGSHMQELRAAVEAVKPAAFVGSGIGENFTLENGQAQLAAWFSSVSCDVYDDGLVVTEVEPLVAYVHSMHRLTEAELGQFKTLVEQRLAAEGAIHITKSTGLFKAQ